MIQSLETIPPAFMSWARKHFGEDSDKIDLVAAYDPDLSLSENQDLLAEEYPQFFLKAFESPGKPEILAVENQVAKERHEAAPNSFSYLNRPPKSICIVGETRSGKTALSYAICAHIHTTFQLPVYVYNHPRPDLLQPMGYKNLQSIADVERLQDCILYCDEPQLSLPAAQKRNNDAIMALLSMCGQRGITLILSTSDTRYVNRGLESYIECWMVKDLDPLLVKQGSTIRNIIRSATFIDWTGFRCEKDEYVFSSRSFREENGRKRFALPEFWNDALSSPYRIAPETARQLAR
jgi:hypothetical protein